VGQDQHRHDDVFGHCRLVAEHVANGDALWHRGSIEEIEPGGYRLQQAKARRGREPRPPNMANDDFRTRQQRGKMSRIGLIIEDRGLQRASSPWRECVARRWRQNVQEIGLSYGAPSQHSARLILVALAVEFKGA
jgi:hypothetical protein